MSTQFEPDAAFATHRATVELLKVFLDGRCYDTMNPYARKEFKEALVVLANLTGAESWMDTNSIFLSASMNGPVPAALCDLARVFILGDNYEVKNPYSRSEVKSALSALAAETGVSDWMDTDTIFARVRDPDMAEIKKKRAEQQRALFDARVLSADIAFLTTDMKCRASTLGQWASAGNPDALSIGLGLVESDGSRALREKGVFTVYFLPESTRVLKVEAYRVGTAESLIDEKPKPMPAMGL
jgi:hypothetical protein